MGYRWLGLLATLGCAGAVWAQAPVGAAPGIYTCTDAQGRRITSDRPIHECIDREQKLLSPSGTVKRRLDPVPTAQELAEQEARERQAAEARSRQLEEKRKQRALLTRYPNQGLHDKERAEALAQVDVQAQTAELRLRDLSSRRKELDAEMEFYQKDPSRAPAALKRQVADNIKAVDELQSQMAGYELERKRINKRFDEELAQLRQLWAQLGGTR